MQARGSAPPMLSRRWLLRAVAIAGGGLALSACGASAGTSVATGTNTGALSTAAMTVAASSAGKTTTAANAAPAPTRVPVKAGQTEIEYWHWGSQEYNDRERRIADAFTKATPTVVVQTINPGDLYTKLLAAFAGNAPPDAFAMDLPWVVQFGDAGVVLDLAARINQDKEAWLTNYLKDPLAAPMYNIIYRYKNDQILALTGEASPNLFFYNADLFRQKGLQTPYELYKADQWTWDALLDAARKINDLQPNGSYKTVPLEMGETRLWMNAAGGEEFDDVKHPKKCLYDSGQSIGALDFLQKAINQDKIIPSNFSKQVGVASDEAFMAGKLAMRLRWTTGIGVFKDIKQFKWGMAPYPKKANYVNDYATGGPSMVAIAKGKPTNDQAWEYAKFKCGPAGLVILAEWGTGVPFAKEAQDKTLEVHKAIPTLETPGFDIELLQTGKYDHIRLISKDQSKLNDIISKHEKDIWANKTSAQTGAQQIAQECNGFLQQNPQ